MQHRLLHQEMNEGNMKKMFKGGAVIIYWLMPTLMRIEKKLMINKKP